MNKVFFLIIVLISVSGLMAQQDLSAREAVFLALKQNFRVQIAQLQTESASINNKWSEAGAFPTVSLNATFGNTIQDNTKNPFTFTPGIILNQSLSPSLSANWNLFSGFAVRINKDRLQELEEQSKGNALVIIENTAQDVLKAYYTAVLHRERLKVLSSLLEFSGERVKIFELREKYSKSSSIELLQYRNQFLTDSTNLLLQELSYHNALRNLNLLLNLPEDQLTKTDIFRLTDSLDMNLALIDFETAKSELLASNQNLKNQYLSVEMQKTAIELQRSFLYPTISFQTGITPNYMWLQDLKNEDLHINTQALSYYGNLNLRYTIFNNWKTNRAIQVAKIQEEISNLNAESMKQSLVVNLSGLTELLKARIKLLQISSENTMYARKLYQLSKSRFEMGSLSSLEMLNAQQAYTNTMIQHYENQFNRLDTWLEIYKMTGRLGLEYQQ